MKPRREAAKTMFIDPDKGKPRAKHLPDVAIPSAQT
jgi:hypothetical protein